MDKGFWTVKEVVEIFEVDERFLQELEEEDILFSVCRDEPSSKVFSTSELEKIRLAKILVEEMDVNVAGVEIILRMRQMMFEMRTQFDDILEDLARQVRERMNE